MRRKWNWWVVVRNRQALAAFETKALALKWIPEAKHLSDEQLPPPPPPPPPVAVAAVQLLGRPGNSRASLRAAYDAATARIEAALAAAKKANA